MSAVAGIVAGLVTAAGALAAYRYAERKTRRVRRAISEVRADRRREVKPVMDFERDPETGVYHVK